MRLPSIDVGIVKAACGLALLSFVGVQSAPLAKAIHRTQSEYLDSDGGLNDCLQGEIIEFPGLRSADGCSSPETLLEYTGSDPGEAEPVNYAYPNGRSARAYVAPNIIVIGWDGTQWDHLNQCILKELPECADGLPNLAMLSGSVLYQNTTTNGFTETKPGWAQIFSGYNAEITGVYSNQLYQPIPEGYTVLEKLERHLGDENIYTIFVSGKGHNTGGEIGEPFYNVRFNIDHFESKPTPIDGIGDKVLAFLDAHSSELFFAGFVFAFPDGSGHNYGENSTEYSVDLPHLDWWLGQIVDKLESLGIYDQTIIYITTDHGFDEGGFRHDNSPYGFIASNDPLIARNGDRKDLPATILQRYGILEDPSGQTPPLNGYSLADPLPYQCVPEGEAYIDGPGAPACCAGLDLISFDKKMFSRCYVATGDEDNVSGYCTDCGNGACDRNENDCNCPVDCPQRPSLLIPLLSGLPFGQ